MFAPEMKIEKFEVIDVITASGEVNINCPEDYDNWAWEPPCVSA